MSHIVILAGSVQEAHKYTRQADLPRGRYICPMSASQIDGVVPSEVHTLPGFRKRRDTHAILATVKRSSKRYQHIIFREIDDRGPLTARQLVVAHRYNTLIDAGIPKNVDPVIAMASVEVTPEDIVAEEADEKPQWQKDLDAVLEPEGWEPPETLTATEVVNLAANPDSKGADVLEAPKRRRSKCATCGTLHFKGDPCELAPDFVIG